MEQDVLQIRPASGGDAEQIFRLVQETIGTVYPRYYPREVVDFFLDLHSRERIQADIQAGTVIALEERGRLIGTGSHDEGNHITRVYVSPAFQGRGHGGLIMDRLEEIISADNRRICLDASLPACEFYSGRGYHTVGHGRIALKGGAVLVYEKMEKDC